jgi:16S rRNA C967 or C1407 C5-methylase (RsmB/RsmF family)/NOL1/NOP2/fmu family ribosome biogenesis protein
MIPDFPIQLLNSLKKNESFDEVAFLEAHKEENKVTSIRINPFKPSKLNWPLANSVSWCSTGYYLAERPSFTLDPLFHAGCYYVQEAGSMFIETALKQTVDFSKSLKILDLCAAPGGKSTLINSLMNKQSLLVANEFVKSRSEVLSYNLSKWGTNNAIVTNNEPNKFSHLESYFDVILVDAPCSGSGLFRKQPESINEWSESAVESCSLRQKNILKDVLPALKQNGILIYSTCSFSEEENEENSKYLINQFNLTELKINLPPASGIIQSIHGYRFYPHKVPSEGFYCSVFVNENPSNSCKFKKNTTRLSISKIEQLLVSQMVDLEGSALFKKENRFYFSNHAVMEFVSTFDKYFYYKKAGTSIGEIKGKSVVPDHELALSINLNTIGTCELGFEEALCYLRKQNFGLFNSDTGLKLVTHSHHGLGWAKLLSNRINNYLPNEYRILK